MDTLPLQKRAMLAVKRQLVMLLSRVRRALGILFQIVLHDQLGDLSRQTRRLGSASVESVTYLGSELRALDERLSRIEEDLAGLRELIERSGAPQGGSFERSDEVTSRPPSS